VEEVVLPSDMGVRSERAAKTNTLLRISGGIRLIGPGMRMGGLRRVPRVCRKARRAREGMKVSMNGCGAHDRQISTLGVSDEPMSGISPAYITVKLKQKGAGVGKVKFKLMPLGFYTVQPWPISCGPEYG
jgi:hypothetical protein